MAIKTGVQNPSGKATGGKEEKEILVPLTTSLYVPGRLCTGGGGDGGGKEGGKEKEGSGKAMVIVDIGTGYYVEKVLFTKLLSKRHSFLHYISLPLFNPLVHVPSSSFASTHSRSWPLTLPPRLF